MMLIGGFTPYLYRYDGGSYVSGPAKIVLHTTETAGRPEYGGQTSRYNTAPHFTIDPVRRLKWQHHEHWEVFAARAMRNASGGVQTNRDTAYQIEIVGYSAKSIADQNSARTWVGDFTLDHMRFIAGVVKQIAVLGGVPLRGHRLTVPSGSECYGTGSRCRMTMSEWDSFGGVCEHKNVPENTHWDCGALDTPVILEMARSDDTIEDPDQEEEKLEEYIRGVQESLTEAGYDPGPIDGKYGPKTLAAMKARDLATTELNTSKYATYKWVKRYVGDQIAPMVSKGETVVIKGRDDGDVPTT